MATGLKDGFDCALQLRQVHMTSSPNPLIGRLGELSVDEQLALKDDLQVRTCLVPQAGNSMHSLFDRLTDEDDMLQAKVQPIRKKMSDAQRRYYFGVIVVTCLMHYRNVWGEKKTKDEAYWADLVAYGVTPKIGTFLDPTTGASVPMITTEGKTLSQMTIPEASDFIEFTIKRWNEKGVKFPEFKPPAFIGQFIKDE